MDIFIGIDVGTSAVRVCAIDAYASQLAEYRQELPAPQQQGGQIQQHAVIWLTALQQAMDELCNNIQTEAVRRIAIDATSATLLLCTTDGKPITPALMYNDSSAIQQARIISQTAPFNSPARSASSSLAKLLLLSEQAETSSTSPWLATHQADWLNGQLTGKYGISDENNALKLGYDALQRNWPFWLQQLKLPNNCLPQVFPPGTEIGKLLPIYCKRWHMPDNTLVTTGTTDSTAGVIATGIHTPGNAVTSLGSTLVLKVLSSQPISVPEHGVYSQRLGDQWLVGGASNTGGAVLKQFFSTQQLETLSKAIDLKRSCKYHYYPLACHGERFPVNDPEKISQTTPRPNSDTDFLHELLNSIAQIEKQGYDLLASLGAPYPDSVVTTGGGAVNPAWTAIRKQHLAIPVTTATHQEAAYGAALLARGLN